MQKMVAENPANWTYHPFPDRLCNDQLWNLGVTWYTDNPDFTQCFQSTLLVWIPCAFLWLMLPVEGYHVKTRTFRIKRWTWVSLAKMVFCLFLVVLAMIDLFDVVYNWSQYGIRSLPYAEIIAPAVKAGTFILAMVFIFMDKRRARSSSGVLFFFWLFLTIAGAVSFRSLLNRASTVGVDGQHVRFVTQVIYFPLIVLQLIMSCFGEYFPELETSDKNPCPEQYASFVNHLTFWWFNSMAYLGWKRPLQQDDLWDVLPEDRTRKNVDILEKHWDYEIQKRNRSLAAIRSAGKSGGGKPYEPSLTKALLKTYWFPLLTSGLLRIINDLSIFVTPQILRWLISFVEDLSQPSWKGYFYSVLILVGSGVQTIILNYYLQVCFRIGMHCRGSVVAAVYRKSLKITSEAKRDSNVGEIVNLMSVDAQRFMDFMAYIHILWSGPFQMGLAIYFLYQLLGIPVFAGLGTMLIMFPLNAVIIGRVRGLQIMQMKEKDGRIKIMTEILNGIKVLKLYAWEASFQQQVTDIRERELTTLRKAAYFGAVSYFTWIMSPFLVALATFATFVMTSTDGKKNILTPEIAFVALALLNILRLPLTLLPSTITMAVQVNISIKRLTKFFRNEELNSDNVRELPPQDTNSVSISDGTFSWAKDDALCLKNINLDIMEGQLVAVVGHVGSGKTSLCAAMLGLMEKLSGDVAIKGKVAYVPQQAWIQNLTLRDNILFGKDMEGQRYQKTLDACSLRTDLDMLSGGDLTEIGERGTNLSGGQRQRVSLARAVYSDSDVYFLDDPLSAVDAHVGKHIFENVIGPEGVLNKKTRILVTHGISFLSKTDLIVVLDNGEISEVGTYKQLLYNKGAFADFLRTYLTAKEALDEEEEVDPEVAAAKEILEQVGLEPVQPQHRVSVAPTHRVSIAAQHRVSVVANGHDLNGRAMSAKRQSVINTSRRASQASLLRRASRKASKAIEVLQEAKQATTTKEEQKGKLVELEKSEIGGVKWSVYFTLMKQMSYVAVIAQVLFYSISYGVSMGANFWLTAWALDSQKPLDADEHKPWFRDLRLGIYAMFGLLQGIFVIFASFSLAYGRIRASRNLQNGMLTRIMHAPMAFFDTTPLGRIVNRFSKDIDTVDTLIPANIEVWLYCCFSVLSTIIVMCVNMKQFAAAIIPLGVFYYFMQRFFISTSRQLKRLEAVTRSPIYSHFQESITGASVIIATKQSERFVRENELRVDTNNASYYPNIVSQRWIAVRLELIGIFVTFFAALFAVLGRENPAWGVSSDTIGLSISYSMTVTQVLNWFVRMTSELESNVVSVERINEYSEITNEAEWISPFRPPKDWPTQGRVEFENYKTRYRPELDLVLKGVQADIAPGEKIGIVGRTGAGKSSLTLALFRIIEAADGAILIDGVNIADMGLHDVRSRITILPQEPVLFSGTLRLNLDPFNQFTDDEVWSALENSHLKQFVSALPKGLEHLVADGGDNYSVGQRQLICLARALLRKTKILVLDEATAAIDLETDDLIQKTISDKFSDCTILTIAHRLNTIMDSTRIMVLDHGRVSEFASPAVLLSDKNGVFYGLAKTANLVP